MFSLLRSTFIERLRKPIQILPENRENLHALIKINSNINNLTQNHIVGTKLLAPNNTSSLMQMCGMKVKGWLKPRCKDCYFVRREGRLYIICETHPRHKQMQMVPKEKNTWIITHATQGKVRPW